MARLISSSSDSWACRSIPGTTLMCGVWLVAQLDCGKLTRNLKGGLHKKAAVYQGPVFSFHVRVPACNVFSVYLESQAGMARVREATWGRMLALAALGLRNSLQI